MCGILGRQKRTATVKAGNAVSMEHEFDWYCLVLQPFDGSRCGVERVHLQAEALYQREIERNVLTHTHGIDDTRCRQILWTNVPACSVIPQHPPVAFYLCTLPQVLSAKCAHSMFHEAGSTLQSHLRYPGIGSAPLRDPMCASLFATTRESCRYPSKFSAQNTSALVPKP